MGRYPCRVGARQAVARFATRAFGGEMKYILAVFVGILLLIFGVVGGLLDLIF